VLETTSDVVVAPSAAEVVMVVVVESAFESLEVMGFSDTVEASSTSVILYVVVHEVIVAGYVDTAAGVEELEVELDLARILDAGEVDATIELEMIFEDDIPLLEELDRELDVDDTDEATLAIEDNLALVEELAFAGFLLGAFVDEVVLTVGEAAFALVERIEVAEDEDELIEDLDVEIGTAVELGKEDEAGLGATLVTDF